jgi:hydroxymethylbilane synthase
VTLRLATRGSALALAQAKEVAGMLGGAEIVECSSDGEPGDKARFVRGVEKALLDGRADLGVHSAKDLPADLPEGLAIAGAPAREAPEDAWVGTAGSLDEVPEGARVGTASLRRQAQLLAARPDLVVEELHGNVDTRLRRLGDGDFEGIVLAAAGMRRLGREAEISFAFGPERMTPAAGQGILVLEARSGDEAAEAAAAASDAKALTELTAERAVVAALDASCATPIGVNASLEDGVLALAAFVGLPDGSEWVRDSIEGDAGDPAGLGRTIAERLLAAGAGELLRRAEAL